MLEELEPTRSERVIIWRRRSLLTQSEAAQEHGVSHRRWGRWERGAEEPKTDKEVGQLTIYEKLFLVRRRKKVSQREVADSLGCTRAWVQMMETGQSSSEQLHKYWKERLDAR